MKLPSFIIAIVVSVVLAYLAMNYFVPWFVNISKNWPKQINWTWIAWSIVLLIVSAIDFDKFSINNNTVRSYNEY